MKIREIRAKIKTTEHEKANNRDSGEGRSSRSHSLPDSHYDNLVYGLRPDHALKSTQRESSSEYSGGDFYALLRHSPDHIPYSVADPPIRRNKSMKNLR